MSASKRLDLKLQLKVLTTLSGSFINSADNTVTEDGMTVDKTGDSALLSSTTVPVTKSAMTAKAMSGGAATLDLTAMSNDSDGATINFSGLKVQAIMLTNPSTNANKITATQGASNGYGLNAAGDSWTLVLDPGQSAILYLNDTAPDVGGSAKTIDISGTSAQVLNIGVVAG